jgi:poly-gamma-glutamate synthesis protein (capsule biosynthesis protein)
MISAAGRRRYDDYEGITGHERYRDELRLLYFPRLDPASGQLTELRLAPFEARQLRLHHPSDQDAEWLRTVLDHVSRSFGSHIDPGGTGFLALGVTH